MNAFGSAFTGEFGRRGTSASDVALSFDGRWSSACSSYGCCCLLSRSWTCYSSSGRVSGGCVAGLFFSCLFVLVCSVTVLGSSVRSPIDSLDSRVELVRVIRCDEQVPTQDSRAAVAVSDVGAFEVGSEPSSEECSVAATQVSSSLVGCTWSI